MSKTGKIIPHVTSQVRQALREYDLIPQSKRVLIALSGGQDSVTLAETLNYIHRQQQQLQQRRQQQWSKLSLVHCDHGWPLDKGTTDVIEHHAQRLNLPLHMIRATAEETCSIMSETKAREWRYKRIGQVAKEEGYDIIVTGHTRSDVAETVLYNLCNGAGLEGLSSLGWKRLLTDNVLLVRPLLNVSRDETEQFCKENDLRIWNDPYNYDEKFTRNRIRHQVIPLLQEAINPKVEKALARSSHLLADDIHHLQQQVDHYYPQAVIIDRSCIVALNRPLLMSLSIALQRRIIRKVLSQFIGLSYTSKTFAQVESIRSLIRSPIHSSIASLSQNTYATVQSEQRIVIQQACAMSATTVLRPQDHKDDEGVVSDKIKTRRER